MREDPAVDPSAVLRLAQDILTISNTRTPAGVISSTLQRLFPETRLDLLAITGAGQPIQHVVAVGAPTAERPPSLALASNVVFARWLASVGYRHVEMEPLSEENELVGWLLLARRDEAGDPPHALIALVGEALRRRLSSGERAAELAIARKQLHDAEARLSAGGRVQQQALLVAGAAHNLGNAMSVLVGYAELIMPELPAHVRKDLQLLIQSAKDSRSILFRALARSSAVVHPRAVVSTVIQDAVTLTRALLNSQNDIAVELALAPDLKADIEASELREVLVNLILNAVTAMPGGGTLRLRSRTEAGAILIDVADSGIGIAHEAQVGIFEPLVTTRQAGSGLGLAVSRALIERVGGQISVTSAPGEGTVFTIRLPSGPAAADR